LVNGAVSRIQRVIETRINIKKKARINERRQRWKNLKNLRRNEDKERKANTARDRNSS